MSVADWRAFYDENCAWIHRVVLRLGAGQISVEDAVQDVFLAVFDRLPSFEGRAALRTWIYRICLNVTSEHRRRAKRRARLELAMAWAGLGHLRTRSQFDVLDQSQDIARVHRALSRMKPKKRDVFILCVVEGLSAEEAAEVLGASNGTIRSRLHYARQDFEALLGKGGDQ